MNFIIFVGILIIFIVGMLIFSISVIRERISSVLIGVFLVAIAYFGTFTFVGSSPSGINQVFLFEGEKVIPVDFIFTPTHSEDEYARLSYKVCKQNLIFGPFTDDSKFWMTEVYFSSSIRSGYEDEYFQKLYRKNAKYDSQKEVCDVGKNRVVPFLSLLIDSNMYRLSRDGGSNRLISSIPYFTYYSKRFTGSEFLVEVDSIKIVDETSIY